MIGPGLPGQTLEAVAEGFACGQVGTLTVTIDDGEGNNVVGPTTANIVQLECSEDDFGVYRYLGVFPPDPADSPYVITWEGASAADPDIVTTATEQIEVSTEAPALPVAGGPCTAWITWEDVLDCCSGVGTEAQDALELAVEDALLVLHLATGERFTGLCGPITERPCGSPCGSWQRWRYSNGTVAYVPWAGTHWQSGCGCRALSEVRLSNYPVAGIAQVKIDGQLVAPSGYRLDHGNLLVRKDNGRWPSCQDLSRDDDESGTFSVSYWYGRQPPQIAKDAAAALACEFFKACNPGSGECRLPKGTTRIVRNGITIEKAQSLAVALSAGATGIATVDHLIGRYGGGKSTRPQVWSPDLPWPRRTG